MTYNVFGGTLNPTLLRGFKSASIARSQVWLGLPIGRFQSEGSFVLMESLFELMETGFVEVNLFGPLYRLYYYLSFTAIPSSV